MNKFYCFLVISFGLIQQSFAQSHPPKLKLGIAYGFADLLRGDNESYYNYTIKDYRLSVGIEGPIQHKRNTKFEFIKSVELMLIQSDYTFEQKATSKNVYRVEVQPSLAINYSLTSNWISSLKGSLGMGYGGSYQERLPEGFFFTENIALGIDHQFNEKNSIALIAEYQHISNLNFYKLNRGFDLTYLQIQWKYQIN